MKSHFAMATHGRAGAVGSMLYHQNKLEVYAICGAWAIGTVEADAEPPFHINGHAPDTRPVGSVDPREPFLLRHVPEVAASMRAIDMPVPEDGAEVQHGA